MSNLKMTAAVARAVNPPLARLHDLTAVNMVNGSFPVEKDPGHSTRRMISRSMSVDSSVNYEGAFEIATLYDCDQDFEMVLNNISDRYTSSKQKSNDMDTTEGPEDPRVHPASKTSMASSENDSEGIEDFVVVQMSDLEAVPSDDAQSVISDEADAVVDKESYIMVEDSELMSMERAKVETRATADKDYTRKRAVKKKSKKEQGRNKKWKHAPIATCGFEISVTPTRNGETALTEEMEEELKIFEDLCKITKENTSDNSESDAKLEASTRVQPEERPKIASGNTTKASLAEAESSWYDGLDWSMEHRLDCLCAKPSGSIIEDFSGSLPRSAKRLRRKKKWSNPKAHKQIKTKYCDNVRNQYHGTSLYINLRVYRRMPMLIGWYGCRFHQSIRQLDRRCHIDDIKAVLKGTVRAPVNTTPRNSAAPRTRASRNHPRSAYTLTAYNADGDIQPDLVNVLLSLQDRELTPEDYETLLRLDERVRVKTIDSKTIDALKTDTVSESIEGDICAICIGEYLVGMTRKHLPCGHCFHKECLVEWLNNSTTCPLDGLEVPS